METGTVQTAPRPRGRPRSARAHEAIIDAVLAMLAEGTTVEALSMEAVAARAGVGKATIYRRWPHKDALVLDAVASIKEPLPAVPGKSVREDLVLLVRAAGRTRNSRAGQILPCMIPELQRPGHLRDEYIRIMETRREVIRRVLRRGIATGEVRPDTDVELTCALLVSPIVMSLLGSHARLDTRNLADRVVDTVLRGVAVDPAAPTEPGAARETVVARH
jgi:AcrR family transcriptional regulator